MNTARKIEPVSFPPYRRKGDRNRAIGLVVQRVERDYSPRLRRINYALIAAAALLLINGVVISLAF